MDNARSVLSFRLLNRLSLLVGAVAEAMPCGVQSIDSMRRSIPPMRRYSPPWVPLPKEFSDFLTKRNKK